MNYKIIVYELIIFKIEQNNRIINKKYFKKIFSIDNVNVNDLSKTILDLKKRYKDNKYIIDFITNDNVDYIGLINKRSEKQYIEYIKNVGL